MNASSQTLLEKLEEVKPDGYQISVRMGMMNSTKAIYLKQSKIYLFNIEDDFVFDNEFSYTTEEFLEKYSNYNWLLEMPIG